MRTSYKNGTLRVLGATDFDLAQTLFCGQCFRWRALPDGSFEGVAGRRVGRLRREGEDLLLEGVTPEEFESFWRGYLDLDTDYAALRALFLTEPGLRDAVREAGGIRVLRQDGWEALASFILSQNNNIKRITGIVERLCAAFGDPLDGENFSFPGPERLAGLTPDDLAPLRSGFRARYLIDAARRVRSGEVDLSALPGLPLDEARAMLTRITGVGVKVADCALLFGFYRLECFPVDVWIGRALAEFLPDGLPEALRPYGGIAQQMLFHYVRQRAQTREKRKESHRKAKKTMA